ncbi:hypothetical protein Bbelb_329320, partial [Branchiostoma belcheri]
YSRHPLLATAAERCLANDTFPLNFPPLHDYLCARLVTRTWCTLTKSWGQTIVAVYEAPRFNRLTSSSVRHIFLGQAPSVSPGTQECREFQKQDSDRYSISDLRSSLSLGELCGKPT